MRPLSSPRRRRRLLLPNLFTFPISPHQPRLRRKYTNNPSYSFRFKNIPLIGPIPIHWSGQGYSFRKGERRPCPLFRKSVPIHSLLARPCFQSHLQIMYTSSIVGKSTLEGTLFEAEPAHFPIQDHITLCQIL